MSSHKGGGKVLGHGIQVLHA